ncbi:MAG: DpnI domain-containing protein [Bacteroidota bacterium]|nr:DpnI domain-containing protein [Bacteroidota bacterium]MDP4234637.1 DpnI domain-containing protein [Bacteroidota bacterium]MDP4243764.1 DpnI domain-containing protein [Bacteroidota bacterium]MDP4289334.1 DpnI domain-containing protein [Bacteroidota bacterium]
MERAAPILSLQSALATNYKSNSQRARVLTEPWVEENVYCPACGSELRRFPNGSPLADLFCPGCNEQYELKSKAGVFGSSVADGAYAKKVERLSSNTNPSLFLLSYRASDLRILSLVVIPKFFFVPRIIRDRPPLSASARRAGWIGSIIKIDQVPDVGKISMIQDGKLLHRPDVLKQWERTDFLSSRKSIERRSWLIDTLECIERIKSARFRLADVYSFEGLLSRRHPENRHVRDKVRQQLQVLRDQGLIRFLGDGLYEKMK